MQLGNNKRIYVFSLIFFIFFSNFAYSYIAVVFRAVPFISQVTARVISKKATQAAANDAVYLTTVNSSRAGLNGVVARAAANTSIKDIFKKSASIITWGGLAYQAGVVAKDYFTVNTDSSGNTIVSTGPNSSYPFYGYINSSGTGDVINGYSKDSIFKAIYAHQQNSGSLTCPVAKCTYSSLYSLDVQTSQTDVSVYKASYDYTYIPNVNVTTPITKTSVFQRTIRPFTQPGGNPSTPSEPDNVSTQRYEQLKTEQISDQKVADMLNDMISKAKESDSSYAGIQPNITASDVADARQGQHIVGADLVDSVPSLPPVKDRTEGSDYNGGSGSGGSGGSIDMTYPIVDIPEPNDTPDMGGILAPLFTMFDGVKSVEFHNSECPVYDFTAFGATYDTKFLCDNFENLRSTVSAIMMVIWSLSAFRIVMEA